MTRSSMVVAVALAGILGAPRAVPAQSTHYFFGGTGDAKPTLGTEGGTLYMGPGNAWVVRTDGDVSGAEREAVPVVVENPPATLTNFAVGLGGRPGTAREYAFGVCIARSAANACGAAGTFCSTASGSGTGVSCTVSATSTGCTDKAGSLPVCDGDRLMVKGWRAGTEEPSARRVKWSFQLIAFD